MRSRRFLLAWMRESWAEFGVLGLGLVYLGRQQRRRLPAGG